MPICQQFDLQCLHVSENPAFKRISIHESRADAAVARAGPSSGPGTERETDHSFSNCCLDRLWLAASSPGLSLTQTDHRDHKYWHQPARRASQTPDSIVTVTGWRSGSWLSASSSSPWVSPSRCQSRHRGTAASTPTVCTARCIRNTAENPLTWRSSIRPG